MSHLGHQPEMPPPEPFNQPADWPIDALDPEAATLAESWSVLRELLESATPPVDEAALLNRLHKRIARAKAPKRYAVLALAASLLLAAGLGWLAVVQRDAAPAVQPVAERPVAPSEPLGEKIQTSASAELAWDDPLQQQLAHARRDILQTELSWHKTPDALSIFRAQLDELEQELAERPL